MTGLKNTEWNLTPVNSHTHNCHLLNQHTNCLGSGRCIPRCKNAMPCHLCVDNGWQSRHYMASMDSCCLGGWWYFIVWLPRPFWTNTGASRGSPGKLAICSPLACDYSKYTYRWAKQISTMQTHWILSQKICYSQLEVQHQIPLVHHFPQGESHLWLGWSRAMNIITTGSCKQHLIG